MLWSYCKIRKRKKGQIKGKSKIENHFLKKKNEILKNIKYKNEKQKVSKKFFSKNFKNKNNKKREIIK